MQKLNSKISGSPLILASITIGLWSFGAYLGRLISLQSQFLLALFSFLFAGVTLGIYFLLQARHSRQKLELTFHWRYLIWGSLGYFAYSVPQIQSFRAFGSASETTILTYTWPIFAMIFSRLFLKGRSQGDASQFAGIIEGSALLTGLFAVALVASQGNLAGMQINNPTGLFWGLITGVSYGLFSAYSASVPRARQAAFLLSAILASCVLLLPLALSEWDKPGIATLHNIGISAVAGVFLSGVGYITWTAALSRSAEKGLNISGVLSLIYILPLLSLVVIAVLLHEGDLARPYFLASALLIVISSILSQRSTWIAQAISDRLRSAANQHV